MSWEHFIFFAIPTIIFWIIGAIFTYKKSYKTLANTLQILGIATFACFIVLFWIESERPPLRTMGETRLWYSFFISLIGYITYKLWKYPWLLSFSNLVAIVFILINLLKPEIHSKNLMPALQSYWFVPHVTVYILSYALFGAATIASIIQLKRIQKNAYDQALGQAIDNLVYIGYGFLMLGMLMGCFWAKDAWGDYWSWDPKETWAFVTAAAYLVYIHIRLKIRNKNIPYIVIIISFVFLIITWLGVSYLPSAQTSIHVY